jgi:hypothetical protein
MVDKLIKDRRNKNSQHPLAEHRQRRPNSLEMAPIINRKRLFS